MGHPFHPHNSYTHVRWAIPEFQYFFHLSALCFLARPHILPKLNIHRFFLSRPCSSVTVKQVSPVGKHFFKLHKNTFKDHYMKLISCLLGPLYETNIILFLSWPFPSPSPRMSPVEQVPRQAAHKYHGMKTNNKYDQLKENIKIFVNLVVISWVDPRYMSK